jgi:hypothetical protein
MSVGIESLALASIVKTATFQYSDGPHGPQNRAQPIGKTQPATYSAVPRKGQKIIGVKHSDVPVELRAQLRRKSSSALARLMHKAGGPTAQHGDAYAAVLEERGVNPNLAATNMTMARTAPNDTYFPQNKTASLRLRKLLG